MEGERQHHDLKDSKMQRRVVGPHWRQREIAPSGRGGAPGLICIG